MEEVISNWLNIINGAEDLDDLCEALNLLSLAIANPGRFAADVCPYMYCGYQPEHLQFEPEDGIEKVGDVIDEEFPQFNDDEPDETAHSWDATRYMTREGDKWVLKRRNK